METIYRVTVRTTNSVQPGATFWSREVLYCGTDREAARVAFHGSEPNDYWRGYGSSARETICDVIADAETDDFADDIVTKS